MDQAFLYIATQEVPRNTGAYKEDLFGSGLTELSRPAYCHSSHWQLAVLLAASVAVGGPVVVGTILPTSYRVLHCCIASAMLLLLNHPTWRAHVAFGFSSALVYSAGSKLSLGFQVGTPRILRL